MPKKYKARILTAISSLLLISVVAAQDVPNPFLAPVQAPPPLLGTPPNGEPPLPEPVVEPTPTVFQPYGLSPIAVSTPNEALAPATFTLFAFEPEELLPLPAPESPASTQATASATASPAVEFPADTEGEDDPVNATSTPADADDVDAVTQEGGEPTLTSSESPAAPAASAGNDVVHVLGITTGVNPIALLSVNGITGPYSVGSELPNGYVIEEIDPVSITFTLATVDEGDGPESEDADESNTSDEESTPVRLRVNIR